MSPPRRRTIGRRISTFCGHVIYWVGIIGTIVYGNHH